MLEAIAYLLWITLVFALEAAAILLAILLELLLLLIKGTRLASAWTWRLVLDLRRWKRSPRELAVRDYPEPKRERPQATAPLPPRELKR